MVRFHAVAILLGLAGPSIAGQEGGLRVDEGGLRVALDAERSRVRVPVRNGGAETTGTLRVEALRPGDEVVSAVERRVAVPAGASLLDVELPVALGHPRETVAAELLSDRLRYELTTSEGEVVRGLRGVENACENCFRLEVSTLGARKEGGAVELAVEAHDRAGGEPAADVEVTASWAEAKGESVRGRTGPDGTVSLRLVPREVRGLPTVRVEGRRGALLEVASVSIPVGAAMRAIVTTDRPLYRPGQAVRVRLLALDQGRVLAARPLEVRVLDPQRALLDRRRLVTSAHGVAHFEWAIPESEVGDHWIVVQVPDAAEDEGQLAQTLFRVARYELPVFRLEARPLRTFHLPGDDAEVEVLATTLTGEPLRGAAVRATRGGDEEVAAALTDARGRALLMIDLGAQQRDLKRHDRRFVDDRVDVHAVDPVSRRTESRRVEIRVTREPLHVYWQALDWQSHRGLPLEGWVSTYSADGVPVSADVDLSGAVRARARTNKHGLAKLVAAPLRGPDSQDLWIEARDRAGRTGHVVERVVLGAGPAVSVTAEKALLRPGEPARLRVRAHPEGSVTVRLWQDGRTLASRRVEAGPTGTRVELEPGTCGAITAVASKPTSSRWPVYSSVTLLCPEGRRLRTTLTPRPARGRPGATIEASLALADGRGEPLSGVVGLVGVDVALLDRARSEEEFGRLSWGPAGWPDDPERSGVRRSDLEGLDPRSDWSDLQVVAEAVLAGEGLNLSSEASPGVDEFAYVPNLEARTRDLKARLEALPWTAESPATLDAALTFARREGLDLAGLSIEDPWGNPLIWEFVTDRARRVLRARSPGLDEEAGTADDHTIDLAAWRWYAWAGPALERALARYLERTSRLPASIDDLAGELGTEGFDPAAQRDPWGQPLGFDIRHRGRTAQLAAWSLAAAGAWPFDAIVAEAPMFVAEEAQVRRAVSAAEARLGRLPRDEAELGLVVARLTDPWGHACALRFSEPALRTDRQVALGNGRLRVVPVTEHAEVLEVVGAGPDGTRGTGDDVVLASFRRVLSEDDGEALLRPDPAHALEPTVTPGEGAVCGLVMDEMGSPIPGATVTFRCGETALRAVTSSTGAYAFAPVPPAEACSLVVELTGFRTMNVLAVAVAAGQRSRVDVHLRVGGLQDVVEVVGSAPTVETSSTASGSQVGPVARRPAFTPRLREHFPETLVWQPEVIVDASGHASVRFPLADSLTTWKLEAIASTDDGRVARADAEVVGALPLAVELDPPPTLTVGDRIELPVPVRNLLDRKQGVALGLEGGDPSLATGSGPRRIEVPRDGVVAPTFPLQALAPARAVSLTASAVGPEEGDRVRRSIEVRADGEPLVSTLAEVTRAASALDFEVPAEALAGSIRGELRILPDLADHIAGAVEGALSRPSGCGEQLVSAAFPGLLALEMGRSRPEQATRARNYVQRAVDGLALHEQASGGFAYWRHGASDAALSAHALRFLARAQPHADVDPALLARTRAALLRAQQGDGSWAHPWHDGPGSRAALTAQVARGLAESSPAPREPALAAGLERAWTYLGPDLARLDEPYLLATAALLAQLLEKPDAARTLLDRLRGLERRERDGGYWELQTNTPFFGWGAAGRVETTGLVLQALGRLGSSADGPQADRALRFLLRRQDGHGVWWTSQATVNVLEGLVAHLGHLPRPAAAAGPVEIWLDAERLAQVTWPEPGVVSGPLLVDIGPGLQPGKHHLELRGAPPGLASLQLVLGHARRWSEPQRAPALRFSVEYDRRELRIGEAVEVTLSAERAGFGGHGMLLAEVGLPPGADVDRASLEAALRNGLQAYEVQPDRVVLYLWPTTGGSRHRFRFRARYALVAQSAPSELYDYYNPEESTRLRPARFVVRP